VSEFPDELYPTPLSWAERAYPKLIHYNKLDKGGHFAAWEQPQLLSQELRAASDHSANKANFVPAPGRQASWTDAGSGLRPSVAAVGGGDVDLVAGGVGQRPPQRRELVAHHPAAGAAAMRDATCSYGPHTAT
jgi:hypothetical protein